MDIRTITIRAALGLASLGMLVAQPPAPPAGPPPTPKAQAPWDLTGYWVSIVTEDWRFRMVPLAKGDFPGLPLNAEGKKIADAWDLAKDEAAGEPCKAYGAAAIMRVPGRLHITWDNENTLKIETDAGTQTRVLHFGGTPTGNPSLQGYSVASWEPLQSGPAFGPHKPGSLKVVTTRLRPGYLRRNGVPYSGNTVLTEYFNHRVLPSGETWFTVVTVIEDPENLTGPLVLSSDFKKEPDGSKRMPMPCSVK